MASPCLKVLQIWWEGDTDLSIKYDYWKSQLKLQHQSDEAREKTAGSYSIKIFKNNYNVHVMRGNVCQLEWVIKMHPSTIYFLILRLQNTLKLLFLSKENSDFTKSATICGINLQATPTTPTVSVMLAAERTEYLGIKPTTFTLNSYQHFHQNCKQSSSLQMNQNNNCVMSKIITAHADYWFNFLLD